MSFHVGQKVICVTTRGLYAPWNVLCVGAEYTIADVGVFHDRPMVDVAEAPRSTNEWPVFYASRFRPATSLLTPHHQHEREGV